MFSLFRQCVRQSLFYFHYAALACLIIPANNGCLVLAIGISCSRLFSLPKLTAVAASTFCSWVFAAPIYRERRLPNPPPVKSCLQFRIAAGIHVCILRSSLVFGQFGASHTVLRIKSKAFSALAYSSCSRSGRGKLDSLWSRI